MWSKIIRCYVIDWAAIVGNARGCDLIPETQGLPLPLLGQMRDGRADFSYDDCVDHQFQTWANSYSIHLIIHVYCLIVAYCVAVTCMPGLKPVHPYISICMSKYSHCSRPIEYLLGCCAITDRMLVPDNHLQWVNNSRWCHTAHKLQFYHGAVTNRWNYNTESTTVSAYSLRKLQLNCQLTVPNLLVVSSTGPFQSGLFHCCALKQ